MDKKILVQKILLYFLIFAVAFVSIGIPVAYSLGALFTYHPQKEAKDGQIKVACVGDSITYGHNVSNWQFNNYPAQLNNLLGDGYCVNNFGYSNRTAQTTGDYPYTNEKLYQQSLDFDPDIVVIMLGTNDTKSQNWKGAVEFCKEYEKIIDSYINLGATVYVLLPVPIYKPVETLSNDILVKELIPSVKKLADKKGLSTINMYEPFDGKEYLFDDGIHPNAEGAKLFAQTVYEVIK